MKVVGVVGSPRSGGNTEILTKIALEEVAKERLETELITLADKKVLPCDGCRTCRETGCCHIKDDFEEIYAKMIEAEGIILSTPVYYGAATPQMTGLISRCYGYNKERPFEDKVGGPIVVARRAGQNFAFAQLMFFFMINGMIVPGSTYWNIAFGKNVGDVMEDEEGLETIRNFGRKVAWLIKKTHS